MQYMTKAEAIKAIEDRERELIAEYGEEEADKIIAMGGGLKLYPMKCEECGRTWFTEVHEWIEPHGEPMMDVVNEEDGWCPNCEDSAAYFIDWDEAK